jgi:hypothetical protein
VRGTRLRGWPAREQHDWSTPAAHAAWATPAATVVRGIRDSAALSADLDAASARIRLDFETSAQAVRFAAGLGAENTPAQSQAGCAVWLDVAPDYSDNEITQLILGVTKVAHYLRDEQTPH